MKLNRVQVAGIVLVTAMTAALSSCGSDSSTSPSTTEASTTEAELTGDPIKVMTISPTNTPQLDVPEPKVGADAAAARINATGGINGRPLEVIYCNDKNDPNEAEKCARQAVDEKVVAVVGSFSLAGGARVIPILEAAMIPYVGSAVLSAEEMTSKVAFPITGSTPGTFMGAGRLLAEQGAMKVQGVRIDLDAAAGAIALVGIGLQGQGQELAGEVIVPLGSTDLAAQAQAALKGGDGVAVALDEQTATLFFQALIDSGVDFQTFKVSGVASNVPPSTVARFGDQIDGLYYTSPFPALDDPALADAVFDIQSVNKDAKIDEIALSSYYSTLLVADIAKNLASVDAETMLTAMGQLDNYDMGVFKYATMKERATPGFTRLFNTMMYSFQIQNGKAVQLTAEPVDVLPGA
jgi:ABC-type branched-subunit amino acid transport system substrate-binding protein